MVLCRVREARHYIAKTAKARVGSRHSGFFTIRSWLSRAGTGIPEKSVKFEHAHAVEVFRVGRNPGNVNR